jgi:hypothetical protein
MDFIGYETLPQQEDGAISTTGRTTPPAIR